jgi:hypothetical protein
MLNKPIGQLFTVKIRPTNQFGVFSRGKKGPTKPPGNFSRGKPPKRGTRNSKPGSRRVKPEIRNRNGQDLTYFRRGQPSTLTQFSTAIIFARAETFRNSVNSEDWPLSENKLTRLNSTDFDVRG